MKKTLYFPEIFELIGEEETKEGKITVLHRFYQEKGFIDILRLCYEPKIKWMVTRAEIENLTYDHMDIADYDLAPTTLFLEARRRLYNFTDVRNPPLPINKIQRLIANMFSVLHHKEIELFKQMVDRNILDTGLSEELVREAFPNLLTGEYIAPVPEKRKPGRPPGAKNKSSIDKPPPEKKKMGRPPGAKGKKKKVAKKRKTTPRKTTPRKKVVKTAPAIEKVVDKTDTVG